MANSQRYGIGRVVRLRCCGKCKYSAHHVNNLIFLGSAIAYHGLLYLKRGIFNYLHACPVRRKEYHSPCVGNGLILLFSTSTMLKPTVASPGSMPNIRKFITSYQ